MRGYWRQLQTTTGGCEVALVSIKVNKFLEFLDENAQFFNWWEFIELLRFNEKI